MAAGFGSSTSIRTRTRSGLNPCSTTSAPPRTRKAAFGPTTRTKAPLSSALKHRARERLGDRVSTRGGANPPALVLAPLSFLTERRAGAWPPGRRGVTVISIGRGGFTRGYRLDDRRRVERIADAAPPHGAESCRGSRPASNAALFHILRFCGNLIALPRQSLAISEPRLSRETAILVSGQLASDRPQATRPPPGFRCSAHQSCRPP